MSCLNCHTLSCYICRQVTTGYDRFNQVSISGASLDFLPFRFFLVSTLVPANRVKRYGSPLFAYNSFFSIVVMHI